MVSNNFHILVIDDMIENFIFIDNCLKQQEYQTTLSKNFDVAWNDLDNIDPNLILISGELNQKKGMQFCESVKGNHSFFSIPIIVYTSSKKNDDIRKYFEVGIDDYLSMPIKKDELAIRIANQLRTINTDGGLEIVEFSPSVLISVDINGKIYSWNRAAEKLTSIKSKYVLNKNIFHTSVRKLVRKEEIVKSIYYQKKIIRNKVAINTNHGHRYKNVVIYPIKKHENFLAVIRIDDVTKEFHRQEQIAQSKRMDIFEQLAGTIAHDFNNMLSQIITATQQINQRKIDFHSRNQNNLDIVINTSIRIAEITSKLLVFGRKGKLVNSKINIHKLLNQIQRSLRKRLNRSIVISTFKNADNYFLRGDKLQIENALMNICKNSGEAMQEGGAISIKSENIFLSESYCDASPFAIESGEFIQIEISDTGCGIPLENIDRIFEPFFTTKENEKGIGLGLAAVYGTIQDHKGEIKVYSLLGTGTVMHIFLPLIQANNSKQSENENSNNANAKILIVDDEASLLKITKLSLKKMGYEVLVAKNGMEALDTYSANIDSIDLILLDLNMPIMDGEETFFKLREINANCKIIICSGVFETTNLHMFKSAKANGYLAKPYTKSKLESIVNKVIKMK